MYEEIIFTYDFDYTRNLWSISKGETGDADL